MKIKNISRQGALDVPLLGRRVDAGEVVDVPRELAARLLEQAIWEPADQAAEKLQEPPSKVDAPSTGENITKPEGAPVASSGDDKE